MKLVSLNIEGDKHFDRIFPFLEREMPDVLCIQEVFESDLNKFSELGYHISFIAGTIKTPNGIPTKIGTVLCSKYPISDERSFYYRNAENELKQFNHSETLQSTNEMKGCAHFIDTTIDSIAYTIGTTHFTWTPDGAVASPEQITSMASLLAHTQTLKPHVLTGDFNMARSKNIVYKEIIKHYTDMVPVSYASSLDKSLHYAGKNPELSHLFTDFMVDYVFTKPPYTAHDVRLEFGISDHAAVIATIEKQ